MSKTELLAGTVDYIQKLSESRLEEIYHFAKFLYERYENIQKSNSFDLTEYFERIQRVSIWSETDINNLQDDIKKFSNWSIQSW